MQKVLAAHIQRTVRVAERRFHVVMQPDGLPGWIWPPRRGGGREPRDQVLGPEPIHGDLCRKGRSPRWAREDPELRADAVGGGTHCLRHPSRQNHPAAAAKVQRVSRAIVMCSVTPTARTVCAPAAVDSSR